MSLRSEAQRTDLLQAAKNKAAYLEDRIIETEQLFAELKQRSAHKAATIYDTKLKRQRLQLEAQLELIKALEQMELPKTATKHS